MLDKPIDALTADDILALVGARETRILEFKSAAVGRADADKREFLYDLTALANTLGGDIVYGVECIDGVATKVVGIEVDDPDKEALRLESVALSGVEPRLPYLHFKWVDVPEAGSVLVVRTQASLNQPHRVTHNGANRFYARHSAGKFEMDTLQLRAAFSAAEALSGRLQAIHEKHVDQAVNRGALVALGEGPASIVTVVSPSAVTSDLNLDLRHQTAAEAAPWSGVDGFPTLEGYLKYSIAQSGDVISYAITARIGYVSTAAKLWTEGPGIHRNYVETHIYQAVRESQEVLTTLGVPSPFLIFITLVGVVGCKLLPEVEGRPARQYRQARLDIPSFYIAVPPGQTLSEVELRRPMTIMSAGFGRTRRADMRIGGE